jgi:hypothetical protein
VKRRILNSESTPIIDNRVSGVRQTVKIQVISLGTVFISTQYGDLNQLDNTGAPVNGTRLTQASPVQDGTYADFLGVLYARSDIGVDCDVTIFNSPQQGVKIQLPQSNTPWNAPRFGGHY